MNLWRAFTRTKRDEIETETKLARVLGLTDLIALGVGSTLGLGVYVLAGSVAYYQAGPAVVISFLIAAITSAFSGLCYAEFAARVPKAGSAYVYSYVTVGEFVAFTIGWNLILEYVIGTSSVARGLSGYLDSLLDNKMSIALREAMPIDVDFLAEYPDFFSFAMILVLTAILAYGVKESSFFNKIFTAVNLVTIAIVIIAGGINADPKNWSIPKESIPANVTNAGEGGFAPFGIAGIMAGAAKCFYGFVGFDCVATTGEEAKNPQRNIPLSIVVSLIIIFLAYFGVSAVLTMMVPYYNQNPDAPFLYAFDAINWVEIKWIIAVGAIFALCTSLLGAMFPLPRVLYAMASDGIIYKYLKTIHPFTKTPLKATILSGLLAAVMALIFDLHQLIDMMSIGTLLAYTIVAVCVLVLRYQDDGSKSMEIDLSALTVIRQFFNLNFIKTPNKLSSAITKVGIVVIAVLGAIIFGIMIGVDVSPENAWSIAVISVLGVAILLIVISIARQPVADTKLTFKVPLVPYIPCFSALINLYLMFQLDYFTWIRFLVWIAIGYVIYFTYGIRKSVEGEKLKLEEKANNNNGIQISTISDFRMPADEKESKSYSLN